MGLGRLLAWVGKLLGTAAVGPGSVVLGDPGLEPPPPREAGWSHWAYRAAPTLVLLIVVFAIFGGFGWPILVLAAAIVLFPLGASLLRDMRRPRS